MVHNMKRTTMKSRVVVSNIVDVESLELNNYYSLTPIKEIIDYLNMVKSKGATHVELFADGKETKSVKLSGKKVTITQWTV